MGIRRIVLLVALCGAGLAWPTEPRAFPAVETQAPLGSVPSAGSAPIEAEPNGGRRHVMAVRDWLAHGFGIQYWGHRYAAEALAGSPHGVLIIEPAKAGADPNGPTRELFFSPEEIQAIRGDRRRPVLGYLNLGEIETNRDYYIDALRAQGGDRETTRTETAPLLCGAETAHGERLAAFWTPEWQTVVGERADRLLELGLDGLFLDDVLHYYTWARGDDLRGIDQPCLANRPKGAQAFARAMMALVEGLAARADRRRPHSLVFVNNGAFIGRDAGLEHAWVRIAFDRYRSAIDAVLVESVLSPRIEGQTVGVLRSDFLEQGLPVLSVDFVTQSEGRSAAEFRAMIRARAAKVGFIPYVADDQAFDRLYSPLGVIPPVSFGR